MNKITDARTLACRYAAATLREVADLIGALLIVKDAFQKDANLFDHMAQTAHRSLFPAYVLRDLETVAFSTHQTPGELTAVPIARDFAADLLRVACDLDEEETDDD